MIYDWWWKLIFLATKDEYYIATKPFIMHKIEDRHCNLIKQHNCYKSKTRMAFHSNFKLHWHKIIMDFFFPFYFLLSYLHFLMLFFFLLLYIFTFFILHKYSNIWLFIVWNVFSCLSRYLGKILIAETDKDIYGRGWRHPNYNKSFS